MRLIKLLLVLAIGVILLGACAAPSSPQAPVGTPASPTPAPSQPLPLTPLPATALTEEPELDLVETAPPSYQLDVSTVYCVDGAYY